MNFSTKVDIPDSSIEINHQSPVLMMGSCFAENIGKELEKAKFDININPFGILYNPLSISQALDILSSKRFFDKDDLFEYNGLFHSHYHHGQFSDTDATVSLEKINAAISGAASRLPDTNVLIITFGTAYVYRLRESGLIVGNCHKLPAANFERFRLDVDTIVDTWAGTIGKLRKANPNIKIIFTVSPVRHLKDGAHENQLSKSTLLLAIDKLCSMHKEITYFPSYEIVMDELRDYRFYAEDMVHVSETAVKYIWEKFKTVYFSAQTISVIDEWDKLGSAINHRPFNPQSGEYKHFLKQTLLKMKDFQRKYSYIYCEKEITALEESLRKIG